VEEMFPFSDGFNELFPFSVVVDVTSGFDDTSGFDVTSGFVEERFTFSVEFEVTSGFVEVEF